MSTKTSSTSKHSPPSPSPPSSSSSSLTRPATLPSRYRNIKALRTGSSDAAVSKALTNTLSHARDLSGPSSSLLPTSFVDGALLRRSFEWRSKSDENRSCSKPDAAETRELEVSVPFDVKHNSRPVTRKCHFEPPSAGGTVWSGRTPRTVVVGEPQLRLRGGGEPLQRMTTTETADADCSHRPERRGRGSCSSSSGWGGRQPEGGRGRSEGCSPHSRRSRRRSSVYGANQGGKIDGRRKSSAELVMDQREPRHWDRRRNVGDQRAVSSPATVPRRPMQISKSPSGHGAIPGEPLHSPRCKSPLCTPPLAADESKRGSEGEKRTPARYRKKKDSKVSIPSAVESKLSPPPPLSPPPIKLGADTKSAGLYSLSNAHLHPHGNLAPNGSCEACTDGMGFPFGTEEQTSRGRNLGSPIPEGREKRKVAFAESLSRSMVESPNPTKETCSTKNEVLRAPAPKGNQASLRVGQVDEGGQKDAQQAKEKHKHKGKIPWLRSFLLNPFGRKESVEKGSFEQSEEEHQPGQERKDHGQGRRCSRAMSTESPHKERETSDGITPMLNFQLPPYSPRCGSYSEEPENMPARRSSMPGRRHSSWAGNTQAMQDSTRRKSSAVVPRRKSSAWPPVQRPCHENLTEAQAQRLAELQGFGLSETDARRCLAEEMSGLFRSTQPFGHVARPTAVQVRRRTPWPGAEELAGIYDSHGLDGASIP